ncbi:MAG: hypothetical protein KatS3mg003_1106 [Candidatus Nitrosocaldaceae archaeon]|nr:MAG: hypothetical protein KatS3mg003_1106 [Candidatus Nitrosocaldaceae archaeon]
MLVSIVIGSLSDPSTGFAIGGFIGIIVGFVAQQVLGQLLAGLLILIVRLFKIGDRVDIASVTGCVSNITAFFVVIKKMMI